ncbi:hypothetical protein FRB97_003514 [Tulasnella sp. 331]|nr:hypothetical protein FRB97_003514 [Tulasnella sp. 331]
MALPAQSTRVTLALRPKPDITESTFKAEKQSIRSLYPQKPNDILVRVDYVSIDPAMKGWLDDRRSYIAPVAIGATMRAGGVGTVVKVFEGAGATSKVKVGDAVRGYFGWAEYVTVDAKDVEILHAPSGTTPLDFLGVLGDPGMTAYFGFLDVAKPKAGETVVVSGAAGAVGSIVCQIAKIKGCKVIAIAGGPDKCAWLEKDLGVDRAIDYKSKTFVNDFKKHVGYLDVYFDNVGGEILDLCLTRLNKNARIAICGAISAYTGGKPKGISGYLNLISQRASITGFVVFDYIKRYPEAVKDLGQWIHEGKLKARTHVEDGPVERCPEALGKLFKGANTGKM